MSEQLTYTVPGMHCGHCEASVKRELSSLPGVESVDVDLDSKRVDIQGQDLDDARLREAIQEAGFEPE